MGLRRFPLAVTHREVGKIAKKLLRRNTCRTRPGATKEEKICKKERKIWKMF